MAGNLINLLATLASGQKSQKVNLDPWILPILASLFSQHIVVLLLLLYCLAVNGTILYAVCGNVFHSIIVKFKLSVIVKLIILIPNTYSF